MNRQQGERYRALADFMEWVDPEGYTQALAAAQHPTTSPGTGENEESQP